jgi:peroxiredoxin
LQLRAYQSVLPEIHRLGAELVAISAQTADYALSDVEKKQLTFPVLHDAHNGVSREYGLVFALSDTMKKLQAGFGNPIPKFNGDDSWELAMPGTFVLDRKGSRTSIRTTWCGSSRRPFSMRFGRCLDCPRLGVRVDRDCFWRARELLEAVD